MRRKMNRCMRLLFAGILIFAALAPHALAGETIKLELGVNSWTQAVIDAIADGARRFAEANPGVEVEVRVVTGATLVTRVAGGSPPDVAAVGLGVGGYGESGVVLPLDRFIDDELRAAVVPDMWTNFTWNGHIWGVPALEHGPRLGMVWNADLLAEAGIVVNPNDVLTWAEFFDIADKFVRFDAGGNVTRVGYDPRNGQNSRLFTMAPTWGAEDYFPLGGIPRINHPNIVQALQYTSDRVFGRYPGFAGSTGWYEIAAGNVVASVLGAYAPGEIRTRNATMPITVTWMPNDQRKRIQQVNGWALAIPSGAPNPELSYRLIKFLATDVETQMAIYRGSGFLGSALEFYRELGQVETNPVLLWFISSLSSADHIDAPKPDPFLSRSDSLFATARNQVFARQGAAQPLLDEAQRVLESEMRQQGRQ